MNIEQQSVSNGHGQRAPSSTSRHTTSGARRSDPIYALGYTQEERERLIYQGKFYAPTTRRLFQDARIGPGMRVLDVGCGVGDVSLLVAELVGPAGRVVGVDRDPLALGTACQRIEEGGISNIAFLQGDLRELSFSEPFDAVVGRVVLMYLADPADALRQLARHVRPGGVLAFLEVDSAFTPPYYPSLPLWEQVGTWFGEAMQRAGVESQMGLKLYAAFQEAGLPAPVMRADTIVGTGPDTPIYRQMTDLIRSLLPFMEQLGLATAADVEIETLAERLRDEVVAARGVITYPPLVTAWARK
jgi:ubiquinone/menaquinone biosynthesis C-methylase UbiE